MKLCRPRALRHMALRMLGREDRTSRVAGIRFVMTELSTTPGRPLSWREDSCDGSWKMNTVVSSVAGGRVVDNVCYFNYVVILTVKQKRM